MASLRSSSLGIRRLIGSVSARTAAPATPIRLATPVTRTTTTTTTTPRRHGHRQFSTTPITHKKKAPSASTSGGSDASPTAAAFGALESEIATTISSLKADIAQLRAGGRFNPAAIEALKVKLRSAGNSKSASAATRLGDLAQVIPKGGRMVSILVGDEEHTKPIASAIASSNLSLTAQPDAANPAHQLNIPIPAPTTETREAAVREARAAVDKASLAVRNARGACNKRLKEMEKKKVVGPDEARRELEVMEKVAQKGQKEVKDVFEAARKGL